MPHIPFTRRDDGDARDTRSRIRRSVILGLFPTAVLLLTPVGGISLVDAQETTSDDRFVRGEPDLDVHVPSNTVGPGRTQAIEPFVTNVVFGESAIDETHAGSWEPGEVKTVTHDRSVGDDTSVRPYTFDTVVSFDDPDGRTWTGGSVAASYRFPHRSSRPK